MPIQILDYPTLETMGDAGPIGYSFKGLRTVAGLWSKQESQKSTNWRKLTMWSFQVEEYAKEL